jgi:hypothetical protein
MSTWTQDRLQQIESSDDLHIAPFREDGVTPGTPTWIWSVVVDGELYVRAYNGTSSRWYQAASKQKAGQVTVAGETTDVSFEQVSGEINDRIGCCVSRKVFVQSVSEADDRRSRSRGHRPDLAPNLMLQCRGERAWRSANLDGTVLRSRP